MPSPSQAKRGSITAEWVLTLPAVMLTVWFILAGLSLGLQQSRIHHAAADGARLASLTLPDSDIATHVSNLVNAPHHLRITRDPAAYRVCVHVEATQAPAWRALIPLLPHSTHCALDPTSP